jgi:hypothetical protein
MGHAGACAAGAPHAVHGDGIVHAPAQHALSAVREHDGVAGARLRPADDAVQRAVEDERVALRKQARLAALGDGRRRACALERAQVLGLCATDAQACSLPAGLPSNERLPSDES